jgi:hypothetical protein
MLDVEVLYRGKGGKEELQTCATDESCQSGSLHEINISRVSGLERMEVRRWRSYHRIAHVLHRMP